MSDEHRETATRSSRAEEFPEDRFDRMKRSGRVGAHRVTPKPKHAVHYLIAGLLSFAVLTAVGIVGVVQIRDSGNLNLPSATSEAPSATKTPTPEVDPSASVAILNGTTIPNLASELVTQVTDNQWGTIVFSGSAATSDVTISAVFYSDPADAAAAAGLAAKLGGLSTYTSDDYADYQARLIVLLGSDYAGPGLKEAKAADDSQSDDTAQDSETDDAQSTDTESTDAESTDAEIDPATGWNIDPTSGYPIDPATGLPTDTSTGLVVDPNTGELVDPSTLAQ